MKNVKLLTNGRGKKGFLLTVASILAIGMLVGVVVRKDIIKSRANEMENVNHNSKDDIYSVDEHLNNRMERTIEENGIYYNATFIEENNKRYVEMISVDKKYKKELMYFVETSELIVNEYENIDNSYILVNSLSFNNNVIQEMASNTSRYSWNATHRDGLKGDLWYQWGKSGHGNKYLRIGRKATYRIPYYNLDKSKKLLCDSYVNYVNTCNEKVRNLPKDLVYAFLTEGWEFIKNMLEYGVESIEAIKEANRYYEQAATTYNTIKNYGTKE